MPRISIVGVLLLTIGLAKFEPEEEGNTETGLDHFIDQFVVYTSEHDIISLTVPMNKVNFDEVVDPFWVTKPYLTVYFVEADIDDSGRIEYKGLYSLKDRVATKILESGTDAYAARDNSSNVYFSAKDGIYVFNAIANVTEKYGNFTDSLINILKAKYSDTLYVLTDEHEVYKVTDGGYKKEKLENVKNVQQIVLDFTDKLFFLDNDKVPYVVTEDGPKKIHGIPENSTYVKLIKPVGSLKEGAILLVDKTIHLIQENGSIALPYVEVTLKPTAYSVEGTTLHYYGYNKKIYEFYFLQFAFEKLTGENLIKYLKGKVDFLEPDVEHPFYKAIL